MPVVASQLLAFFCRLPRLRLKDFYIFYSQNPKSMRKIYFLSMVVLLVLSLGAAAQPTVFYTNLTSTTNPALTNSRLSLTDLGAFRQCRFQTTAAPAPATQTYAFHIGSPGSPNYNDNWRPYTPADATGIAYALNTVTVPSTVVNSARYNSASGGTDGNLAALANSTYYTVNIQENAGSDNLSAIWGTTFNPVTFSGISQIPAAGSVNPGNPVDVNITSSATLGSGENVYVRYSTNGFVTSSVVQATFALTTGFATIPGLPSGTNVSYYIFSSSRTLAQLATIVGTAGIGQAGYDMATLNLENNAGTNYSYTVNAGANPVTVNASGGTPTADYGDLKGAFDAINAGTHTGAITVLINGNTVETVPAVLNASGTGLSSYTAITINPSGGGARTISSITGGTPAGGPMIDLNGADNVTFNGLNTGGNSLTITNLSTSATSGTSTIRFIGGATNNTITNCTVLGSATMSVATNGATIFFSTDANTANGNDNNTISNCNIGRATVTLPTKAILGNGSTSTTAIGNSGIVIDNNNIFDFFGAATTSSGIAVNGGCNGWTITNNRFYQTATRTWTTGATHRAIDLNSTTATSGVQGMTVTGNIVGYASDTQTGTYTMTGSTGKFQGIVFNGITGGTLSNISNNTVASVSLTGVTSSGTSTSSPLIGMLITNGLAVTDNNTIGSQSVAGSLVLSTNTTTATDVYGFYQFSVDVANASGNTVGGISVTNAAASGTFIIYGMRANTGTALAVNFSQNTIGGSVANSIQLNATGTSSQVVGMAANSGIANFARNTIRNLTTNIGTGTTSSASVIGISMGTSTTPVHTISQNTIYNLTNTNATAASVVTGIQFVGGTGNIVQRNLIYDLSAATTSASAEVNGIRVAGGTTTYRNNMIRLGNGIPNAIGAVAANSSASGINGFNGFLGTDNFWHNSVYIEGSATAGTGASYAFNGTQTTNTRSFRDNIFFNARSNAGATGSHYAIKLNGTVANPTGLTINNNLYFANGAGGVFGFYNGANVANLAAWQTAVGQDAASVEANPLFVSATDLHLQAGSPAIDVAFNLGVTNDFDGDSRPGANALYDIGADERDGIPAVLNDVQATAFISPTSGGSILQGTSFGPQASFTNNGVNNQTNINVKYRILDNTLAVIYDQTAVIPVLNTTASTTVTFPSTSIATAGTYTIQAIALLAGDAVVTNDTITGTLLIQAPLAGTYTVGSGGNYPSLTNNGGIFQALNSLGASANININIISDLAGETGTHALNELAGGHSVSIQPTGGPRTVTGSINGALIKINGADKVTINGSTTGASAAACLIGGNAAIRELTFQNTNVGTANAVIAVQTGTNGAKNVVLKNLNVLGQDPTTSLLGISIGGNTPGTTGADNDSCRVENCSVKRAIFGIYSGGISTANPTINTIITQNSIDSTSATDRIRRVGILVFNDSLTQVTYNSISGINTNESNDGVGIGLGTQAVDATITTSGGVVGALVANNRIAGVASLSTTGFSAAGITVAGGNTGANVIRNNMITGVTAPATSPDLVAGIFVVGATGANTQLYFNSVSMTGDRGTVATQTPSFGIAITGTDPTVDLRNNILYTTQTSGGGAGAQSYAIGMVSTTFANLNSNYNDFWSTGANDGGFRTGSLGASAGTSYATLAAWQTAVSDDANSLEVNPMFIDSASNLHINPNNCAFKGLGTPITGISDDYDCDTRNATRPDIGADEFVPANATANAGGNQTICGGNTFTPSGATATNNSGVNWTTSGDGTFLNGTTLTPTYTPGAADILAGTVTLTLTATGNAPCANATSNMTLTITTTGLLAGTPGGPAVCQTKVVGIGATYNDPSCNTIATVIPAGGSPVSGNITSCVKVESSIPTYVGKYYVARHYDIEPAVAPSTSSANVVLYFSPAEMAAFNADPGAIATHYPLPVLPTDNTDSVRLEQYHGTGTDPTNYTGALETWSTANGLTVVFSNGYWVITVPATSFSGFWLTSKPRNPLPIKVEYFRGAKQGSSHVIDWKVVPVNTANGIITLERSADGRNFGSIYSITASATRMLQPFNYATNNLLKGTNYYRLKLTDDNGVVTYSSIVALLNSDKGFELVNITPNPVTEGRFKLNISAAEQLKVEVVVTDMAGRVVSRQANNLISGFNAIEVNVSNLANGMYQVMGIIEGERTKVLKFVKQ
jgi:trimeric autotransporter adhesin